MKITPYPNFGHEIENIDLANLTQADFDCLRQAFAEQGLVVIRDQQLTEPEHIALARRFGDINVNRFFSAHPAYPEIALVVKTPDQNGIIGGEWHTDHSYDQAPAMGSLLLARRVPPQGGDTLFAHTGLLLERLPHSVVERLLNLRAVHSTHHVFGSAYQQDTGERLHNAGLADEMPDQVHPAVVRHPLSGKPVLFVNPQFTIRLEGCTSTESEELLALLQRVGTDPEHLTRVKWREGTMTIWDNRATWHCALDDYPGFTRVMHRITIEGVPVRAAAT